MLPIEQYLDAITRAKLSVLEANLASEEIQIQMESIYTPAKYAAYVGSDLKSESQRQSLLDLNLLNNAEYQRLKSQEISANTQYQKAKIELERLQDEFLLLKLRLRIEATQEAA